MAPKEKTSSFAAELGAFAQKVQNAALCESLRANKPFVSKLATLVSELHPFHQGFPGTRLLAFRKYLAFVFPLAWLAAKIMDRRLP